MVRPTPIQRFERLAIKGLQASDCWGWNGYIFEGRGRFAYKGKEVFNYRFSYEYHVGPIPKNWQINHRCGNGLCSNPAHLYAGTAAQNNADEDWPTKIPDSEIDAIKDKHRRGQSKASIGCEYGVSGQHIGRIVREASRHGGERWEQKVRRELYDAQEGICNGCNNVVAFEFARTDHIIPKSQGGKGFRDRSNLQMLCVNCNAIKGNNGMGFLLTKLQVVENKRKAHVYLSDENVRLVRQLHKDGRTQRSLCREFNVAKATMSDIVNHRSRQNAGT